MTTQNRMEALLEDLKIARTHVDEDKVLGVSWHDGVFYVQIYGPDTLANIESPDLWAWQPRLGSDDYPLRAIARKGGVFFFTILNLEQAKAWAPDQFRALWEETNNENR